jgi:uncharacterized protein YndB with AHSA1/START domain
MTCEKSHDIVVETVLPHAVDIVWKALTTAELVDQWLMPNDFKPVVGHKFNFRTKPIGDWNGVVDCEVLEVEAGRRLAYSWRGGVGDGTLDTVVTWTLQAMDTGTHLRMVHSGFRLPQNDIAYSAMGSGWGRIVREGIGRVVSTLG